MIGRGHTQHGLGRRRRNAEVLALQERQVLRILQQARKPIPKISAMSTFSVSPTFTWYGPNARMMCARARSMRSGMIVPLAIAV